ncbi:MAG: Asp-tRNA(Asn)/Glu-tRNA(Gln) amidotransferase subunit GatA [Chloroflexi bacterium]|nr:MAG: Asp-tRNA(Asn)/Glu-tRNA(Gln) amidotransferase subunit GatA [Chloroflexota bacterium]
MKTCDLPAYTIADLIRTKQLSALEVLEETLERVNQVDGRPGEVDAPEASSEEDLSTIHAFTLVTEDYARRQAQKIDQLIQDGNDPGPLAGVPYTAKDIFTIKGIRSTAGSKILSNYVSPYSATVVERMEDAGAVMLGKVNLDEFTYGSSSESSAFKPVPRNPWDTSRVVGGSSGGSAAAVAAGEGAISLGTDTGGSIRHPASFCGTVGLKPTYGRVSRYGLIAFGSSLDCPGPLARNVTDAALALQAIAGQDPRDATSAAVPVPDYLAEMEKEVRGMRIGLSEEFFRVTYFDAESMELVENPIDDQIREAVFSAAGFLAQLGADIVTDVPLPHTKYGVPTYFVISRVEASSNLLRYDGVKYGYRTAESIKDLLELYRKTRGEGFGVEPKLRMLMGIYLSAAQFDKGYYQRALKARALMRGDFETIFDSKGKYRLDALLTPTAPSTAFPIGSVYGDSVLMQYSDQLTATTNHAGIPGLSFPVGFDRDGLPIGAQVLGPDYSEGSLLRIARAYEKVTEQEAWRSLKPPLVAALDS